MNEKIIFIICIFVLFFSSCTTGKNIYNHGVGARAVRSDLSELGEQQTDTAITSTELEGEINRSLDEVERLERTVESGTGDIKEFKKILQRIRNRSTNKTE